MTEPVAHFCVRCRRMMAAGKAPLSIAKIIGGELPGFTWAITEEIEGQEVSTTTGTSSRSKPRPSE